MVDCDKNRNNLTPPKNNSASIGDFMRLSFKLELSSRSSLH